MTFSRFHFWLTRAPLVILLSTLWSVNAFANDCDCNREVASCQAKVDVSSRENSQTFSSNESDAISSWETVVSVNIALPTFANAAYMRNQCVKFNLSDISGRYTWSETLYDRSRYSTSRTIYTASKFSAQEFYVDQCHVCWDEEGEVLKKGLERRQAEGVALKEQEALEENFDLTELQHPEIDLSQFSDEELRQIVSENHDWDYADVLKQRQKDRIKLDNCVDFSVNGDTCTKVEKTPISENVYNGQTEPPSDLTSENASWEKGSGYEHSGSGIIESGEPEDSGGFFDSNQGEPYWSQEEQEKVEIPEGFLDPNNPYDDDHPLAYLNESNGGGAEHFNSNDNEEYWGENTQNKVVIPEGFLDPDNPYEADDPLAAFLNKSKGGWDEMDEISEQVEESRREYVESDWDRISSREGSLGRSRDSATQRAETSLNRIEQSALSSLNSSMGLITGDIYSPGSGYSNFPSGGATGDEAKLQAQCDQIMSSYAPAIQAVQIGNGVRGAAQTTIKQNDLALEGLNKCLQILPAGSEYYNLIYQTALASKHTREQAVQIFNTVNVTSQAVVPGPKRTPVAPRPSSSTTNVCPKEVACGGRN